MMNALSELECPVCLNALDKNHKVLGCQHTFCTDCLECLHDDANGTVRCPECRHLNFVKDVAHLPNNILLMRLLQSVDDQAKKEEKAAAEKVESSSDDEPIALRPKVLKAKRRFRKIRHSDLSDSEPEPVIKEDSDAETDCEKKPVIAESESEEENKTQNPVIESESEDDKKPETEVKTEVKTESNKSGSSSSDSSSGSSDSSSDTDSSEQQKDQNKSGSATDHYFSDCETKTTVDSSIFEIIDPLDKPKKKKEIKRSGRLAERYSKVFQMPSRKSVLDSIPSTSSPVKTSNSAQKFRPRRRVNNFTKVNSSYNKDIEYETSDSDPDADFLNDGLSESGSDYSDCSIKKSKKKTTKKRSTKKKKPRAQRKISLSESEESTEEYMNRGGADSDEYLPPKKKSRLKRKVEYSEDECRPFDSDSDNEKYSRLEPKSSRQKKRLKQSIESGSHFEQLKKKREKEKEKRW